MTALKTAVALLLTLFAQGLAADDWPGARAMTVFSEDGTRFVRVEPGNSIGDTVGFAGANRGSYATALFYVRQADRSYRLAAEVSLLNPVAPVDLRLSNSGYLITFDNWHNLGFGKVVAVYDPTGKPLASWELEQLYSAEQIGAILSSQSSRWWRCLPLHFVDPKEQTKVYVRESLGGSFVFDLANGSFAYTPGKAECQPAGRPFSATYF